MNRYLLFLAIFAATLTIRSSFILTGGGASHRFDTLRRYVPVAALTALIIPALLPREGEPAYTRAAAGLIGALIAWKTKNMLATVAAGIAVLWALLKTI